MGFADGDRQSPLRQFGPLRMPSTPFRDALRPFPERLFVQVQLASNDIVTAKAGPHPKSREIKRFQKRGAQTLRPS